MLRGVLVGAVRVRVVLVVAIKDLAAAGAGLLVILGRRVGCVAR